MMQNQATLQQHVMPLKVSVATMAASHLDCRGVTKNEDFSQVPRWASKFISQAVIYGQDKENFLEALIGTCAVSPVESLDEAIRLVQKTMKKTDVVVYSPAAASFDQFENFQHRGQFFSEQLMSILPA